jgi:hypothetical protein
MLFNYFYSILLLKKANERLYIRIQDLEKYMNYFIKKKCYFINTIFIYVKKDYITFTQMKLRK